MKEERSIVSGKDAVSLKAEDFQPTGVTEELWREKEEREREKKTATTAAPVASKAVTSAVTPPVPPQKESVPVAASKAPVVGPRITPEKHAAVSYNGISNLSLYISLAVHLLVLVRLRSKARSYFGDILRNFIARRLKRLPI